MGLDSVEIVLEMEATFGIVIDDIGAETIGTVGQAYRYILAKLELGRASCPSAVLFYRFRRALLARTGADRRSLRPSTQLADFLPERGRRRAWQSLGDEIGMPLPRLEFGDDLRLAAWFLGLGPVLGGLVVSWSWGQVSAKAAAEAAVVLGSMSLVAAFRFLEPFAKQIPRGCETVRGTIGAIVGQDRLTRAHDSRPWQRDEVWFTLRELIAEHLGVSREEITEDKSFVHDFGMD